MMYLIQCQDHPTRLHQQVLKYGMERTSVAELTKKPHRYQNFRNELSQVGVCSVQWNECLASMLSILLLCTTQIGARNRSPFEFHFSQAVWCLVHEDDPVPLRGPAEDDRTTPADQALFSASSAHLVSRVSRLGGAIPTAPRVEATQPKVGQVRMPPPDLDGGHQDHFDPAYPLQEKSYKLVVQLSPVDRVTLGRMEMANINPFLEIVCRYLTL